MEFIRAAFDSDGEKMLRVAEKLSMPADALADRINEIFSDKFGDIILEQTDLGYGVIDDYREVVEKWLNR